jgi:hypothetical protein
MFVVNKPKKKSLVYCVDLFEIAFQIVFKFIRKS